MADDAILDFILAPQGERTVGRAAEPVQPALRSRPDEVTDTVQDELRLVEREAVRLAEGGRLRDAYDLLTAAIARAPLYASAYNNRAQVLRLMHKDDLALLDLDRAVELAYDTATLRQGLTQRGLLRKLRGEDAKAFEDLERAGQLGSEVARREAVTVNPYAKLCNNMLTQVLQSTYPGP